MSRLTPTAFGREPGPDPKDATIADLRAKLDEAHAANITLRIKIDAASRRIQRELDYLAYQAGLAGEGEQ